MAAEPAPRPWDWIFVATGQGERGHIYIVDANNRKIAAIWGKHEEKQATADLIISSVNATSDTVS
jgi:hypothetical protein